MGGSARSESGVIAVSTAPAYHYAGDLAAWAAALAGGRWVARHRPAAARRLAGQTAPGYFVALALGAAMGAWGLGSLNTLRAASPTLSHSMAGALAGGIIAVELWKLRHGVHGSTGGLFVIPLCLGIVVGRWGCLFAGLPDETFGTPTNVPWAVDLGDGVGRHPVQLYESAAMLLFLGVYWRALARGQRWAVRHGFHAFVIAYAVQRFAWEFLKPYPAIAGGLNLFHLLMLGLACYAAVWIARDAGMPDRAGTQGRAVHLPGADHEPVRDLPGAGSSQNNS